ncbi:hypothetical protein [Candidatus Nitrosocosmicus franklandus]|uniref:Uncharacterized protein n=1 Tax=Candidatus Nitrosocosmicus franklandianus TaxID=1798806 RepID=A0A484I8B8_9ARCH|nr:hypothetical protein [Candidatus Nitrosocosmicus franklandus]VFJ14001.1 conserved protein of unknown function [Candidatus Nitrosocosmicus franklandus]
MWILVMSACIFIIFIIAPISKYQTNNNDSLLLLKTSFIQATISVVIVGILILILNKFKKVYLFKKLTSRKKT